MMKRHIYVLVLMVLALAIAGCGSSGGGSTVVNDTKAVNVGLREFESAIDYTRYADMTEARKAVESCSYNTPENTFWPITLWAGAVKYRFVSWEISQSGNIAVVRLQYTVENNDGVISEQRTKTFTIQKFSDRWLVNLKEFTGLD